MSVNRDSESGCCRRCRQHKQLYWSRAGQDSDPGPAETVARIVATARLEATSLAFLFLFPCFYNTDAANIVLSMVYTGPAI